MFGKWFEFFCYPFPCSQRSEVNSFFGRSSTRYSSDSHPSSLQINATHEDFNPLQVEVDESEETTIFDRLALMDIEPTPMNGIFLSPNRIAMLGVTVSSMSVLATLATDMMYSSNMAKALDEAFDINVISVVMLFNLLFLSKGHMDICERSLAKLIHKLDRLIPHVGFSTYPLQSEKTKIEKIAAMIKIVIDAMSMLASTFLILMRLYPLHGAGLGLAMTTVFLTALSVRSIFFISSKTCYPDFNHPVKTGLKRGFGVVLTLLYALIAAFNYTSAHIIDPHKNTVFWSILAGVIFCNEVSRTLSTIWNYFNVFIPDRKWDIVVYVFGMALGAPSKAFCQRQTIEDNVMFMLENMFNIQSETAKLIATIITFVIFFMPILITQVALNTPRQPSEITVLEDQNTPHQPSEIMVLKDQNQNEDVEMQSVTDDDGTLLLDQALEILQRNRYGTSS